MFSGSLSGRGSSAVTVAVHFVGFKGEEWWSAVRVWGVPDFVHRWADKRFWFGGELCPGDVVVFANNEDKKDRGVWVFNDSEAL